jgi:hypothetical protein
MSISNSEAMTLFVKEKNSNPIPGVRGGIGGDWQTSSQRRVFHVKDLSQHQSICPKYHFVSAFPKRLPTAVLRHIR